MRALIDVELLREVVRKGAQMATLLHTHDPYKDDANAFMRVLSRLAARIDPVATKRFT